MLESSQASLPPDVGPRQLVRLDVPCQEISPNLPQSQCLCGLAQGLVRVWDVSEHRRLEYDHRLTHCPVPLLCFRLDEILQLFVLDSFKGIILL